MTAIDPEPISDADLLTFAVIGEHWARQQRQGFSILLFPYPPCPTCGAQVHEVGVSGMPIATGRTMRLRPCRHRYQLTEDAMLRIGQHAQDMLENLEWNGITGTPGDLAAEARTRLGETPAEPVSSTLYFCPRSGEVESATHGGFDQCCDQPELHVPLPDGPGTEALSQLLDQVVRAPFQRMAETLLGSLRDALAADQTDFVLAPSPDGAGEVPREYAAAIHAALRAYGEGDDDPGTGSDYGDQTAVVLAVRDREIEGLRSRLAALKRAHVALAEQAGRDQGALARLRALLVSDRDQAARNARDARHEPVQLAGDGIVAGLDGAIRRLDEALGRGRGAGDRSGFGPRACDPSAAGHSPGNPSDGDAP